MSLKNVYVDLPKDIFRHGLNLQSSDIVVKSSQLFDLPILNFNLSLSLIVDAACSLYFLPNIAAWLSFEYSH